MDRDTLRDSFDQLRAEIDRLAPGDDAARARLDALLADLDRKLSHPEDVGHHHTLTANLKDAIEHFEVEHPRTTAVLNHIMVTLGNMGI